MKPWTGNSIVDWVLNVALIVIVIVLVVWAIKEIAPIFTETILIPDYAAELAG